MSNFNKTRKTPHKYTKGSPHEPMGIKKAWLKAQPLAKVAAFVHSEEYNRTTRVIQIVARTILQQSANPELPLHP